jgi:lysophosphatidate acyltransferase
MSSPLRAGWQLAASWSVTVVSCALISLVTMVTGGVFTRRLAPWYLRTWGRTMLRIAGVEVVVEGHAHLATDTMKVATFNHGSMLDAFIIASLMPRGGVGAIKIQVLWYPMVGLAAYLLGFVLIDRRHTARARRTMAHAAERMAQARLTVFIAPEGTRTTDGALLPFKKGALHLALATGAPIVPVIIEGAFALHPPGRVASRPGRVRVRVLPPRSTRGLTEAAIGAETAALRALYATELAAGAVRPRGRAARSAPGRSAGTSARRPS